MEAVTGRRGQLDPRPGEMIFSSEPAQYLPIQGEGSRSVPGTISTEWFQVFFTTDIEEIEADFAEARSTALLASAHARFIRRALENGPYVTVDLPADD